MKNIRIWLKFDGTNYHGYQIQKNGYTIQQALQEAIEKITGAKDGVTGCSRTDSGVHAKIYCANFMSDTKVPMDKLPLALNTALPDDIRVVEAEIVDNDFHATYSAKEKTYEYTVDTNKIADPFLMRYAWHYPYEVSLSKMKRAAKHIEGTHDFSSFMAVGGQVKTTIRTVKKIKLSEKNGVITLQITADGFLYNMVRIIMGTLIYAGIDRIKASDIPAIIESKDRKKAGITAPPQGLKLVRVKY